MCTEQSASFISLVKMSFRDSHDGLKRAHNILALTKLRSLQSGVSMTELIHCNIIMITLHHTEIV